jgi:glycosyltransferase involved in cell wall biosynthesis
MPSSVGASRSAHGHSGTVAATLPGPCHDGRVPHVSPLPDAASAPPPVSVVIPCYNAGDTLLETVESALASAYECLEVIVVDDGSTDDVTRVALDSLPEGVVRLEQQNSGLPAARNAGVRRASGSLILPLDADDLIEPDYVPEAVAAMSADPTLGIVYCRATKFGEVEGDWALPDFDVDRILVENCIFSCAMFRRDDWVAVGGYDETMRRGREDHDFWLRIVSLGRGVRRLEGRYFHYRIRSSSMNHGYTREEYVQVYAQIFRNNVGLYAEHPEALIRHRFELMDELNDLRHRYALLERARLRWPGAYASLRRLRRLHGS